MCERDELCDRDPENCDECSDPVQFVPNAFRVLDSYGDVRYTVFEEAMAQGIIIGQDGWTIQPVKIKDPRW